MLIASSRLLLETSFTVRYFPALENNIESSSLAEDLMINSLESKASSIASITLVESAVHSSNEHVKKGGI